MDSKYGEPFKTELIETRTDDFYVLRDCNDMEPMNNSYPYSRARSKEIGERICTCVNALEGIEDVEKFVADARAALNKEA